MIIDSRTSRARALTFLLMTSALAGYGVFTAGSAPAAPVSSEAAETLGIDPAEAHKDEPKAESPKEEPKAEAPKEEPKAEAPKEEPKAEAPKEEPKAEAPKEEPKAETPKEEPKAETPKEEPKAEAPKEEPKAEAPKEEPKAESPKEEPKAEAPKEEPAKDEPKADAAASPIRLTPVEDGRPAFLMEDESLPIVALKFAFPHAGFAYEPQKYAGAGGIAAAVLGEGAGKRSPAEFRRYLESLHADVGFGSDEDSFYITVKSLSQGLDKTMALLTELIAAPEYKKADLPRHLAGALTAVKERDSDPSEVGAAELKKRIWGDHPYARDGLGDTESLRRISPEVLKNFHREAFNPAEMQVSAAGAITAEKLAALVNTFTSKVRESRAGESAAKETFFSAELPPVVYKAESFEHIHIERDLPQTVVLFALPAPTRTDPDFFNYYTANYLLGGGGFESRLMHKLREEGGYAYSVATGLAYGVKGGALIGSAGVSADKADEFLAALKGIVDSGEPFSEDEISRAKQYLERSFALSLSNNTAQAAMLSGLQVYGFGPDYMSVRKEKLAAVTAETLRPVLNEAWRSPHMIAVTVGRSSALAGAETKAVNATEAKTKGAETPETASEAKPAEPKQEEKTAGHGHVKRGHKRRHGH